jgi:uncharacterized protein YfaS (alpha-2-macroglobulin family)
MKKTSPGQRLLLLISFLLPLFLGSSDRTVQSENDNFYLSNYTTFSPGTNVTVRLYSYNRSGGTFKFRLIKIEDPVGFFTSINKNNIRYSFDIFGSRKEILLKYTALIKEWTDYIPSNYYRRNNNVDVGKIEKPGIYILQAMRNEQVAYCGIVVSDLSLVYKNSRKQILAYVANSQTSEFVLKSRISVYNDGKLVTSKVADNDGLVLFEIDKLGSRNTNSPLLIAQAGEETIISAPYIYFRNGDTKYYTAYIYTNQPVYRPGQHVFFKAIVREKGGNEIKNVPYEKFSVTIKSPKNKEVYSSDLTTNEFGTLNSGFTLDEEADLGNYSITLSNGRNYYYGSFSVEEYKKPEYKVEVKTDSKNYASKDIIEGTVSADYYFGSPVTNGEVTLNIYKKQYWRPWWYWSDYKWFYSCYIKPVYYGERQLVSQETGKLNDEGKYEFSYKITEDVQYDYVYMISAEVKDASRRVISGSSDVYVTRGSFSIFTSPDRYFVERGKTVNLRVNANDFSDNPVQTDFDIIINYSNPRTHYNQDRIEVLHGSTDAHGNASVQYNTSYLNEGYYSYTVKAYDSKEREITSSSSFYVGDINNYYYARHGSGLEIVTDKDAYDKGDSLIAYIFLPTKNTELLLTYESDIFIKYKKYKVDGNSLTVREKLTDEFSPSFNIAVCYLKDRQFYTASKLVGVLAKDKFLDITLKPSKEIYKPGEYGSYLVSVKDYKGNVVPNTDLSFGIIDESIYAIKEDATPDIQSFFYAPTYSYIPTYSSIQYSSFSSSSRDVTYIDKNYFKDEHRDESKLKKGTLYGKINIKESDNPAKNIYVILTSEKYYYTARTDTNGNYKIGNIIHGDYELYISGNGHDLTKIRDIQINKKSLEYNFDIEKPQIITAGNDHFAADNEIGLPATELSMNAPRAEGMMMKAEMKDKSAYVKAEVRSNFVDALIWKADIVTDKNGEAKVSFKIPDNLTTWRTTVRGATKWTDVGQQTDKIISRKDLLVRMETPRFFREGDEMTVSTIVHNYLDEKKKTKITFNTENIKLVGSQVNSKGYNSNINKDRNGVYEIVIDKNGELRIDWTVKVDNPLGEAKLTAQALTNEESDAVEMKVPILPKGIRETKPLVSDFNDYNKTEELKFRIPGDVDLRTAKLEFNLSPSLAGTIIKALDDLVGYPYGCVEQTMSRFLPTIIVANTFKDIDAPLKYSTIEELPKMVDAGLKRLYNFQHDDGGWGWWTNDKTHPYMTAYVIYGMTLSKNAGYPVDNNVYSRGVENLKQQLDKSGDINETTLSFMLYSMATAMRYNSGDYSEINSKIENLLDGDLNAYSLALLTVALKDINNNSLAAATANRLERMVHSEARFAYWGGKGWHYRWQNDKVQTTAFVLKALLKTGSDPDLIGKTVRWLLQQKQGFSWRSTQETAAVIFALSDYLKTTNELNPDYNVSVYVNGEQYVNRHFTKDDIFKETKTFSLTGLKDNIFHKGDNEIKIVKNGAGKLYFSGINQYYTQNQTAAAKVNRFNVKREYFILKPEQMKDRIIYRKVPFDGKAVSGENILVKTYVDALDNNLQYFILEDMLPSGFEVVKDERNFEIEGENNYKYYDYWDYRPWRWFYADKEYRDEKVVFFVTNVNDKMEFSYIIKAQMPGEYTVPAAQAYLMYYPEVGGNSSTIKVNVRD